MNSLINEQSAYLRHAAHQKINWLAWSEEAFDKARKENKPVFLSTGAVWCHWCHVMASEAFDDDETARLLNALFIPVKLDRDERPDIDRRYQQAVAAMGGGSGWPLSVFLTPDKEPFYGGTYFPPQDREGRPGFKKVLLSVHEFFHTRGADARDFSRRVMASLRHEEFEPGELSETMLAEAERAMLAIADPVNGGFGAAPKFPMPGALEFLLRRGAAEPGSGAAAAARRMLTAMADGGFRDHLGGGFHRYSVDEAWSIPHFEKMADDNAGLLGNYVDGYALFGEELFREVALGILAFTRGVLSDRDGGFYASQDADVTPADEGGYFTWTEEEFRSCLEPDEFSVLSAYYMHARGRMHHDAAKHVLFIEKNIAELSASLGRDEGDVRSAIARGKEKLLACRGNRTEPFIDRALYPSLNGMLVSAWFHAYAVLGGDDLRSFAARSLDRITRERERDGRLYHSGSIPALLDDYVHLINALIAGYEATADAGYLARAEGLMNACLERFSDPANGGFFDTEEDVLGTRFKKIEDIPHPSANAAAIMALLKLSLITGNKAYREKAEQSLRLFIGLARELSVHGGAFYCSLQAYYGMVRLTVEAAPESELARTARSMAGTFSTAIVYGEDRGRVVPCVRGACFEPVQDPARLAAVLRELC